jgi:AcrR family transcriptional regulator
MLIGATLRYMALRLASGDIHPTAAADVRDWAGGFAGDGGTREWRLGGLGTISGHRPGPSALRNLPRRGSSRERVLRAAAALVHDKGYRACSVADILTAAGVSRRYFYDHFEDKRAAVIAIHEYSFERMLALCAPAFFAPGAWEERVWRAGAAFARFYAREAVIGRYGFGQTYALGPSFARRIEEFHLAFTWFLDGRRYDPRIGAASVDARAALTAASVAELAHQSLRCGPGLQMLAQLPLVMYVVLTPFTRREHASAFARAKRERVAGA